MKTALRDIKLLAVVVCIFVIPVTSASQDLGSTSGLFKSKTATKKKNATKKSTPKKTSKKKSRKPVSRRSSSIKKKTTAAKKSAPASTNKAKKTLTSKDSNSPVIEPIQLSNNRSRRIDDDIVITIGDKSSGKFADLFEKAIAEGNTARNRRMYVDAEIAYSRALSINSVDSRAIYGLGNIYSDQQRWEEAEAAYRKALITEPENPMAILALSHVLTQPVVGSNLGARYAEADIMARKAIEKDQKSPFGYDQLGLAMELRGIISQKTEDAYRKAISLAPEFALAYAHLGRLLSKQGRNMASSTAYLQAVSYAKDPPTMILVAEVMQSQQKYSDSEKLLRIALDRDSRNPTGLYLLGRALITRGAYEEAEIVLTKSVRVSPWSFVSYALLGSLYSRGGDLVRAEQTLIRALDVVSENERKRLALEFELVGDGLFANNLIADASRVYRLAISLDVSKKSLRKKLAAVSAAN